MAFDYPASHYALLVDEVLRAFRDVPAYGGFQPPPPTSAPEAWLRTLPVLAKRDARRGFPRNWSPPGADLNAALAREEVILLATSGTTEERVQILWDAGWWDPQERAAMRLNSRVAQTLATPGYREAILTTPVCGGGVCHIGDLPMAERTLEGNLLFLNQVADPTFWTDRDLTRMSDELDTFAPHGLEADPAYLTALAAWSERTGRTLHRPGFVQLTYEMTIAPHRRRIARAFGAQPVQLYGASEAGVLFMECEHGRLHANTGWTHAELIDVGDAADGAGRLARVIATTMRRRWMPLVRFDLGDVVLVDREGAPCPCGRCDGPVILGVEGRLGDLTWTAEKRPVTPATIDRALAPLADPIEDWKLIQEADGSVRLQIVTVDRDAIEDARNRLAALYRLPVSVETVAAIAPESSGKYRRSNGPADRASGTRLARENGWLENPVFESAP